MGLDIRVYTNKKEHNIVEEEEYYFDNDYCLPKYNECFKLQLGFMNEEKAYSATHDISFSAGSYSGFNFFRRILFEFIYKDDTLESFYYKTQNIINNDITRICKLNRILDTNEDILSYTRNYPFLEFVCFSDCEGVIDSIICKKLYEDFKNHRDNFIKYTTIYNNPYYIKLYDNFMNGFMLAGENNGYLKFC
jgi:hypothetical protein